MSKATTYTVFVNDKALEGTKSKKATAVDLARAARKEQNAAVRVETSAGTVVFEQAAPKKIKMSPRYTRVVPLPEGVEVPDGKRVAYAYNRRGGAILHDAETGEYSILITKGEKAGTELPETFETTRAAGDAMRSVKVDA